MKKPVSIFFCIIIVIALAGCAGAPRPSRPSIRDANYRKEMRSQHQMENGKRIEQLKSFVAGETTDEKFESKFSLKTSPGADEKWMIHVVQRQTKSTRKQDGSFSTDALYYLGTGFQIGTINKVSGYVADIDCVVIFIEDRLAEIRWQPRVEFAPGRSGHGKVLRLAGEDPPGPWQYQGRWYIWSE